MNVFENLQLGAMVINKNDAIIEIWYGGCRVTVIDIETGNEVDVYHWAEAPGDLEQAINWSYGRENEI